MRPSLEAVDARVAVAAAAAAADAVTSVCLQCALVSDNITHSLTHPSSLSRVSHDREASVRRIAPAPCGALRSMLARRRRRRRRIDCGGEGMQLAGITSPTPSPSTLHTRQSLGLLPASACLLTSSPSHCHCA